jgi:glycosyltransferase involved in cell wall biosynthesis
LKRPKVISLVEARVVTGPAKNILRFAAECRDRVDLTIVTFVRTPKKGTQAAPNNAFIEEVRRLNLPIEIVTETGPLDLSVLASLRRICERLKPDIVQTHAAKSHFLMSLLHRKAFYWIAFHHGHTSESVKMRFYNQFDRWSLRACDVVVTVCTAFANKLTNQGIRKDRIFVVPNSVKNDFAHLDPKLSEEARARWAILDDELVILVVGRLSPEKGHRYLIDAIAEIMFSAPHLRLRVLIAGNGPLEGELANQIVRRNLGQHVKLIGHCSDVKPLFSIADLFVLPSLSEGSPNALLESMAASIPIVATTVGGVPEIVSDGESAILVPPANVDMLAKAVLKLVEDRPLAKQLASVAFDKACLVFSPAKYDERILNIYDTLLRRVTP